MDILDIETWEDGHTAGYREGVRDAVRVINKLGKANITELQVATELLETALEDAR